MNRFRLAGMLFTAWLALVGADPQTAPGAASPRSSNLKPDIVSSSAEIAPSCLRPNALAFRVHVNNVGTLASFASADGPLEVADSERPAWVGRSAMPVIPAGGSADVSVEMPAPVRHGTNHFKISLFGVRSATFTLTIASEKKTEHGARGSNRVSRLPPGSPKSPTSGTMRVNCSSLSK